MKAFSCISNVFAIEPIVEAAAETGCDCIHLIQWKFSRTDIIRETATRYRLLVALEAKGFRVIGSSD